MALPAVATTDGAATPAQAGIGWGVVPGGAGALSGRAAFVHAVRPGASIADTVRISNYSSTPISLTVMAQDALTTPDGGFDLLGADEGSTGVGAWVQLERTQVTVSPRSRVELPFRIDVPSGAEPGDHAGGIVAVLTSAEGDGAGGRVVVQRRVGARIYLSVPGAATTGLRVEGLRVRYEDPLIPFGSGVALVDYRVRNTGTLRAGFDQVVTVGGPGPVGVRRATPPTVRQVLPGGVVTVAQRVPGVFPWGRLSVDVAVQAVSPPSPSGAGGSSGQPVAGAAPATARAVIGAVPWSGLFAVLVVAAGLVRWRRARRPIPVTPVPVREKESV